MTSIEDLVQKLKTLTSKWFYSKTETDTFLNQKSNTNHTHGNLQNNGSVGTSNNTSKNVVTDTNGYITTEDKPIIPVASSTKPSADTTNGAIGTSSDFAKADHVHPKSSIYATSSHNHTTLNGVTSIQGAYAGSQRPIFSSNTNSTAWNFIANKIVYDGTIITYNSSEIATTNDIPDISGKADSSDFDTLTATVTYTDDTTETVTFYVVPDNSS